MKTPVTHPPKQRVRDYLDRRTHETEPPPTPEEVRRELGWDIVRAEREISERKGDD